MMVRQLRISLRSKPSNATLKLAHSVKHGIPFTILINPVTASESPLHEVLSHQYL